MDVILTTSLNTSEIDFATVQSLDYVTISYCDTCHYPTVVTISKKHFTNWLTIFTNLLVKHDLTWVETPRAMPPGSKSAILIEDYASVEAVAEHIKELDGDDEAYAEYLSHKTGDHIIR